MIRVWLLSLGISLLLTLIVELSAAVPSGKRGQALLVVALVNCLTNPVVVLTVLLWKRFALSGIWILIAGMELAALIVEGWIYRFWPNDFTHPWRFSLILNLISFAVGELIKLI